MDEKNKKKGKRDGIYIWNEKGQRERIDIMEGFQMMVIVLV